MFIYLNGKREEIEDGMCISKLLERKRIRQEVVTVEQNGQIIDREKFKDTLLGEGDELEFVYYMGGGIGRRKSEVRHAFRIPNSQFREEEQYG